LTTKACLKSQNNYWINNLENSCFQYASTRKLNAFFFFFKFCSWTSISALWLRKTWIHAHPQLSASRMPVQSLHSDQNACQSCRHYFVSKHQLACSQIRHHQPDKQMAENLVLKYIENKKDLKGHGKWKEENQTHWIISETDDTSDNFN